MMVLDDRGNPYCRTCDTFACIEWDSSKACFCGETRKWELSDGNFSVGSWIDFLEWETLNDR